MALDVTDADFEQEVLVRSDSVPVVIDLWAPWCGPCKTLGPIIERLVDETDGGVVLAKVNVDDNPRISASFQVQSIPAVFAISERKIVDQFIGALPEAAVRQFIERLAPVTSEADQLVEAGDEASLRRALELEPDHAGAIAALGRLLVEQGDPAAALELIGRVPETADLRKVAALARLAAAGIEPPAAAPDARPAGSGPAPDGGAPGGSGERTSSSGLSIVTGKSGNGASPNAAPAPDDGLEAIMDALLERVKADDAARQELVDLLETMADDDPRRATYRRALTSRLY